MPETKGGKVGPDSRGERVREVPPRLVLRAWRSLSSHQNRHSIPITGKSPHWLMVSGRASTSFQ